MYLIICIAYLKCGYQAALLFFFRGQPCERVAIVMLDFCGAALLVFCGGVVFCIMYRRVSGKRPPSRKSPFTFKENPLKYVPIVVSADPLANSTADLVKVAGRLQERWTMLSLMLKSSANLEILAMKSPVKLLLSFYSSHYYLYNNTVDRRRRTYS